MQTLSFIFLLFLSYHAVAQETILEPRPLTFDELKNYLETQNGEVLSSKLHQNAAENRQGFLRRKFTPTFNLEAGGEKFSTGPYNNLTQPFGIALVNLNLFNGSRDVFTNEIIKTEIQQKTTEYNQKLMNELLKVRKLYWEYLYQKAIVQILTHAMEMNSKNLSSAMVRIRSGIATSTDKIEFEQNGIQVQQDLSRAKIELSNLEREIKAVLGWPEEATISTSEIIPHEHADDLHTTELKIQEHRNNLWLDFQKKIVENQRKISRNWWAPTFDLYASAAQFTQKERDYLTYSERSDFTLGIRLTMNIFDGGENYNQSKSYYLESFAIEKEASQVRKELVAGYKNARAILELTHEQIHSAEENVNKSENYFQNTLSEYGRGIKNSPDVLQATQRLVNSKIRLLELKKDYQVARSSILYSLGQ